MNKMDQMLISLYVMAITGWKGFKQDFMESERGDTNFISMLLIIAIVVVFAGLFLTLMKDTVWKNVEGAVTDFFSDLGGE